jgi:hypothetical protein
MWLLKRSAGVAVTESDVADHSHCTNEHCSQSSGQTMPFDCSERGALACA